MLYQDLSTSWAHVRIHKQSDRYIVSWRQGKQLFKRKFRQAMKARKAAERVLKSLEAAFSGATVIEASEAAGRIALIEKEAGITIEQMFTEWKVLATRHAARKALKPADLLPRYLETLADASPRHLATVKSNLNAFVQSGLSPEKYLAGISHHVTHNNHRASLSAFYRWAERVEGAPNIPLPPAKKPPARGGRSMEAITVIQPWELPALLNASPDKFRPYLAIAALAGVRTAEIQRLRWSHIELAEGIIRMPREITKVGHARTVEIHPTLHAILTACSADKNPLDPVCPVKWPNVMLARVAHAADVTIPHNALRHSCATYSMALYKDAAKVASNLGNSTRILQKHYLGLASKSEAEAYFNLTAEKPAVASTTNDTEA